MVRGIPKVLQMDQDSIRRLISKHITESDFGRAEVYFEENDAIRILVVSNKFKGMRLLKRIDALCELFMPPSHS
jgi:stress-induced morphogen